MRLGDEDDNLYAVQEFNNHITAPQSKNTVCTFQYMQNYFLLPWRSPEEADDQWFSITIKKANLPYQTHVHTPFYHGSRLTSNYMFNGSIYYV